MADRIGIFPATSQLGRAVIRALVERGADSENLVAAARRPEESGGLLPDGVVRVEADYENPDLLRAAFEAIDVLFLIPTKAPVEARVQQHGRAVEAAVDREIDRIVLSSVQAAEPDSVSLLAPFYLYAESRIRVSPLQWTILRNTLYLDPVAEWAPELARTGRLPYPVDRGRVAYASRRDLADAAAAALLQEGHEGRVYELTGPEALSMPELAEMLSEATGHSISYERVSESKFAEICRESGTPAHVVEILVSLYRAVDEGEFAMATDHVEQLTGSPAESVRSYLSRVCSEVE